MLTEPQVAIVLASAVKAQLLRALDVLDTIGIAGAGAYVCSAIHAIETELSTEFAAEPVATARELDFSEMDAILEDYFSPKGSRNAFVGAANTNG